MNYYLITALPEIGQLGSVPPMALGQLLEHVDDNADARAVIEVLFLADDLLQRDALLAGEIDQPAPSVLTEAQLRAEEALPAYLAGDQGDPPRKIAADAIWEKYFRHASAVARRTASAFLADWVAHEVALRNALVSRRSRVLELDEADYIVAAELASDEYDFTATLNEWADAADPLAASQVLDRARWAHLADNDRYFSFADDELAAYATRLMLVRRWYRISEAATGNREGE